MSLTSLITAVLVGVFSSLVVATIVESMRKPRLRISILPPQQAAIYDSAGVVLETYVALKVSVSNDSLPLFFRWMQRQSARDCRAALHFLRQGMTPFIERPMPGRWAASDQPVPLQGVIPSSEEIIQIYDVARLNATSRIHIPAGEAEELDVAVRFPTETDAFGWTNESYRYAGYRHPRFKLPANRYLVDIVVRSEGVKKQQRFRIENDHTIEEFHIRPL